MNIAKNQVIDGFIKGPAKPLSVKETAGAVTQPARAVSTAAPPNKTVNSAAQGLHRGADKAHTLMRGALKSPGGFSARIQTMKPGFNPQRELRAKKITKHSGVNRFGLPANQAARPKQVIRGEVIRRPSADRPAGPKAPNPTALALPSMITSASHQKLERMLDAALTSADAHKQALKRHSARHFWKRPGFLGKKTWLKVTLLIIVFLAAGSYLAWQKVPQLSLKLAGAKANIKAAVPSYKPEGYSLAAPASTQAGAVVLKYKAPDNSQGFDISQKPSNLTSASLAQTVVPAGSQVQTSQVNGNTVYIYGSDAAWVNNGVLYTIKDRSKLTSDQILNIVRGLN